jgi:hypothetical protein
MIRDIPEHCQRLWAIFHDNQIKEGKCQQQFTMYQLFPNQWHNVLKRIWIVKIGLAFNPLPPPLTVHINTRIKHGVPARYQVNPDWRNYSPLSTRSFQLLRVTLDCVRRARAKDSGPWQRQEGECGSHRIPETGVGKQAQAATATAAVRRRIQPRGGRGLAIPAAESATQ